MNKWERFRKKVEKCRAGDTIEMPKNISDFGDPIVIPKGVTIVISSPLNPQQIFKSTSDFSWLGKQETIQ